MFYKITSRISVIIYFLLIIISMARAYTPTESIRLNQIGFYPDGPKFAVAVNTKSKVFYITSPDLTDTLFTGTPDSAKVWIHSGELVKLLDFTKFKAPGQYTIFVPDLGQSYVFDINNNVHYNLTIGTIKGYYFQRASLELTQEYADIWHRPSGHPDTLVYIHPSAASDSRLENSFISSPRGWYDAGDYNKYILSSAISLYTILTLYEHFPEFCQNLHINIPESKNNIPDILDEVLWNLRWMFTMQDSNDGGIYHKLTHASFSGEVMPHQATSKRYVVQKSTAAALNFVAVMAQANRVFGKFHNELPGLADSCLTAALDAWKWVQKNPETFYDQTEINRMYDPDIRTGVYGDHDLRDEYKWATTELFLSTKRDDFLNLTDLFTGVFDVPSWPIVGTLALYSLAFHKEKLDSNLASSAKTILLNLADNLKNSVINSEYHVVIGISDKDFIWGSNEIAANQGMALVQAYLLTLDDTYLHAAIQNLDYLLGRNATGYCFVTGFGSKSPKHIHHRPSQADNVLEPVPGLLVGGPNPDRQDKCSGYIGSEPARSYSDSYCSFASNEIDINWNAPLVYLVGAIEAIKSSINKPNVINSKK